MTELEFKALAAQGYNRIPLVAETYADLDTPLAIYLKLAHSGPQGGRMSCLMESVVGGERFGRYSFIGLPARTVIRASGSTTEVLQDGHVAETHEGDPLAFIESYQARFKVALRPGMPRFAAAWPGTSATTPCATSNSAWARRSSRFPTAWKKARPTSCCCTSTNWSSSTTWPAAPT